MVLEEEALLVRRLRNKLKKKRKKPVKTKKINAKARVPGEGVRACVKERQNTTATKRAGMVR